jgi:hypothetical protein
VIVVFVIVHVILDLRLGVDNPKRRMLGAPQLKVANALMAIDLFKEIFDIDHDPDLQ